MTKIVLALAVVAGLAACAQGPSRQTQSASVGGIIGAAGATILDEDPAKGALIGAAGGLACAEAGAC